MTQGDLFWRAVLTPEFMKKNKIKSFVFKNWAVVLQKDGTLLRHPVQVV